MLIKFLKWTEKYTKTNMLYVAKSNFWLVSGRAISIILGFGLTVAFANLLPPEKFGVYKYIVATAGIISAFSLNGMGAALLRAIGNGKKNVIPGCFKESVYWSLPASIIAIIGGIYYLFQANFELGFSFIVIGVTNPLLTNLAISKVFFVAVGNFKLNFLLSSLRSLTQIASIVLVLILSKNILLIVATYFIVGLIVNYIIYIYSLKILSVKPDKEYVEETVNYSKHLSLLGGVQLILNQLDQILMWHFVGPSALATYAMSFGPVKELRTVGENINSMIFPKFANKTTEKLIHLLSFRVRQLFFIYVPILIIYLFSAPFLFKFFFPQYIDAVFYSQLLATVIILQPRAVLDLLILARGDIVDRYNITIPSQIIKIILFLVLIPLYGLIGGIIANILFEIAVALVMGFAYRKFIKKNKLR